MKTAKKALLLILCAIALVVATIMGTLAYLQDTTEVVKNTMTAGKVIIDLDESKVDLYGVPDNSVDPVTENEYKLIPGHTYIKNPTIHVDDVSEDAYLFVEVINGISGIEADTSTIADQMTANGWVALAGVTNVYYHSTGYDMDADPAKVDFPVFEDFTIKGDVSNETINSYEDATIQVKGYAVQIDGFDTPAAAWTAAGFTTLTNPPANP